MRHFLFSFSPHFSHGRRSMDRTPPPNLKTPPPPFAHYTALKPAHALADARKLVPLPTTVDSFLLFPVKPQWALLFSAQCH
jgi:hypothetical protein